jgi:hypothetical protein
MMRRVVLVGAGQLGRRYVQGILLSQESIELWVYDIDSLAVKSIETEFVGDTKHTLKFISHFKDLPQKIGLVIVAVPANSRLSVVTQLLDFCEVDAWILEKVLCQSIDELEQFNAILGHSLSAWVNTPRLGWSLYQNLAALYPVPKKIEASIVGFKGLACNAIHYIDLVGRWSASLPSDMDSSALNPVWFESKRSGFFDVDGMLKVNFANGSKLNLWTGPEVQNYSVELIIDSDTWTVSELDGYAQSLDGKRIEGRAEYQSELVAPLVTSIFEGGEVRLPLLSESIAQHRLLISGLLAHWCAQMNESTERLPVT